MGLEPTTPRLKVSTINLNESKQACKDQESIQSSTTPNPGYQRLKLIFKRQKTKMTLSAIFEGCNRTFEQKKHTLL